MDYSGIFILATRGWVEMVHIFIVGYNTCHPWLGRNGSYKQLANPQRDLMSVGPQVPKGVRRDLVILYLPSLVG